MKRFFAPLLLSGVLLLTGCSREEGNHPQLQKAQRYREAGDAGSAARVLRQFLLKRPDSARAHRMLGDLCGEELHDELSAVYHYRTYLELVPDAADAQEVRRYVDQAEKNFYLQYRAGHGGAEQDRRLAELDRMQKENARLRSALGASKQFILKQQKELLELRDKDRRRTAEESARLLCEAAEKSGSTPAVPAETPDAPENGDGPAVPENGETAAPAAEAPAVPAVAASSGTEKRLHVVRQGETLSGISRQYYGSAQKFPLIMEANGLESARDLKPGQTLEIPQEK